MKSQRPSSPYTRAELRRIRKLAMGIKGAQRVTHITPRALCTEKPAPLFAVFRHCPCDTDEPDIWGDKFSRQTDCVQSMGDPELLRDVAVGDWCSLAYIITPSWSAMVIVEKLC